MKSDTCDSSKFSASCLRSTRCWLRFHTCYRWSSYAPPEAMPAQDIPTWVFGLANACIILVAYGCAGARRLPTGTPSWATRYLSRRCWLEWALCPC